MPALAFVATVLLLCGTLGWRMIGKEYPAEKRWKMCNAGLAHWGPSVVESGSPGADITRVFCAECKAIRAKMLTKKMAA